MRQHPKLGFYGNYTSLLIRIIVLNSLSYDEEFKDVFKGLEMNFTFNFTLGLKRRT